MDFAVFIVNMRVVASFPGLHPVYSVHRFAFTITWMRKGGEKRGRPGIVHHVSDIRWARGACGGGGGGGGGGCVVISAGPEGCSL